MAVRNGKEYLSRLRENPPNVYLGGERIVDPVSHPATRGAALAISQLYDLQHSDGYREYMLFHDGEESFSCQYLLPQSADDLKKRYLTHLAFAKHTLGLLGRSTDFLGAMISGFYLGRSFFGKFAENLANYYEFVKRNDLFLTHALIDPPFDRSKPPWQIDLPYGPLRVADQDENGIVVRGAKLLATAAPYADEVFVWPFVPLGGYANEGADYAVGFALPSNTQGLTFICREPYGDTNPFDHPLASRFDEMDCIAIFEDVFVPWDRVFLYREPALVQKLYAPPRGSFSIQQSYIRLWVKLLFAAALAKKLAEITQAIVYPNVQHMISEITTYAELVKAAITASMAQPEPAREGSREYLVPNVKPLLAVRVSASKWYPRVKEILQLIGGANLLFAPISGDLRHGSPTRRFSEFLFSYPSLEDRLAAVKLAYDLVLSSFAGRHELYERFYAGDPYRLQINYQFVQYDWREAEEILEKALQMSKADLGKELSEEAHSLADGRRGR
ncbi:MAG: pyoverdine biosynthesis protein PvcC [Candidatus Caldarchaeum sp.]|nr:pyoverdine biosynthesis protein PvcC [Candidatus Caldarchaeum sp.]